jgi:hypothetical protein
MNGTGDQDASSHEADHERRHLDAKRSESHLAKPHYAIGSGILAESFRPVTFILGEKVPPPPGYVGGGTRFRKKKNGGSRFSEPPVLETRSVWDYFSPISLIFTLPFKFAWAAASLATGIR